MTLNKYQREVLAHELQKDEYASMTAEQAHDFLHKAERDRTPRIAERFSGAVLRKQGIPTLLGHTLDPSTGAPVNASLAMPNAFDKGEFRSVFDTIRGRP